MKIHLHSKPGLYEVVKYGRNSIMLSTKHNSFSVPVNDFKSFAGGLWNHRVTKDEMDQFLALVKPDEYQAQVEMEDKILTLAARADRIKAEIDSLPLNQVLSDEDSYYDELARKQEQEYNDYQQYLNECALEEAKRTPEEWNNILYKKEEEIDKLNKKIITIASRVYSEQKNFNNFKESKGIKFIIQQNHFDKADNRFCWDPYGFVFNSHSAISEIYREGDYYTDSGGWIKTTENKVILYYKSSDYGVYDNDIAIECAKKLFPGKGIYSFAGRTWDDELESRFFELPF